MTCEWVGRDSSILNGDKNFYFFFSPRQTTARIPRYARINTLKWSVDEAIKTFQKSGYTLGDPLDGGMYVPLMSLSIEVFFIDKSSPQPLFSQELRTGRARREPSVVSPAVAPGRYPRVF